MKKMYLKIILVHLIFLIQTTPFRLNAQHIEITPFAGYITGGKVTTNVGYLRIADGANVGGSISFGFDEETQVEFTFHHLNSELSLDRGDYIDNRTPVNSDYYMLGAYKARRLGDRFLPYGGGALGLVHYGTPDSEYGEETLFAVNMSVGMKILFTERFGFRMQARLQLPIYYTGAYFSAGTARNAYGITSTCVMVQGDFTGALFFVID